MESTMNYEAKNNRCEFDVSSFNFVILDWIDELIPESVRGPPKKSISFSFKIIPGTS